MAQGGTLLRDAILVTRSLGFRYIWIDTLCLNQDDDLEKLDQISKMHIFYSRAVINLSATAAEGGANGMIQDRYPFLFAPLTLSMANATSSKGGVSNDTSSSLVFFKDERGACIHDAKIYSRGWVFQERMLAQRVLHFASDQVYWECHSLDLCDTTPSEKSFGSFEQEHEKKSLSIPAAPLSSQADVPADHAWQLWQDLLGSYTKTNVTFPNDKLVALGALARRFGEAFRLAPREYVAGLWTGHLSTALCWEAQTPSHRPSSYRAPTWSWASIQTSSGYSGCRSVKDDMQVVDVSVTAKNATDPFGELVDGRLRIRGTIFKSFYVKGDSLDDIGDRRLELVRTSRSLTAPAKSGRAWLIVSWDLDTWGAREASSPQVSKSYFLLPLFRGDDGDERLQTDKEEELFIGKACLVLRQTGKKGQYVREGIILSSFWTVTDDEPRPPLRNRIEYTEEALSDEDYLKSHNDGSHTIEIV